MSYKPTRTKRWEMTKTLVEVALGREKADLTIKNVNLINVYTGEIQEKVDIAIKDDRIALVGEAEHATGYGTQILDAQGLYAAPGFIDGHIHIESSMLTPTEFARAVVPRGTTAVFADPHEVANVLGLEGVRLMVQESRNLPLKVYLCVPSCVPASAPDLETAGAKLTLDDIREALGWSETVALGEMMNYPGVLEGDPEVHAKLQEALKAGKVVEGHSPSLLDAELCAYRAAGPSSCHEETTSLEAVQRLRLGMYAMIREGSGWRDLHEAIKAITVQKLNPRRAVLVSDDRSPKDLLHQGHMDHIIRRAIEEGVDPVTAIQMATLNPAEHFKLDGEIGGIAPGLKADITILENLEKVKVKMVVTDGMLVAKDGILLVRPEKPTYPELARNTVRLKRPVAPEDLKIRAPIEKGMIKARIIGVEDGKATTKHIVDTVYVENGEIKVDTARDVAKVAVVERHKATGNICVGLVRGFNLKAGAIASTVAHDSHNIIAVGADEKDMAHAVNKLSEIGGGIIAVHEEKTIALIELPIAGLMSDQPVEVVAEKEENLEEAWRKLGCKMKAPTMILSLLALPVIPELRITDKGIIDVKNQTKVDVIYAEQKG